ncbi:EF-hand calcium-binding domain-containing protein 3-like [Acipenser oxyrinchus oxyrinchus]|uniref:EF-hand calcium-binding domain-containing protein 3-like n=1 Tax=Acipenser oxyrinchus oxyrinchus TaxID=40147 RepID=A0AAD8CZ96_ACIOX|nr:EF-hand calcium-binding domain-containing protein 3-like [Acipenser oxyrinchus oxyrinchus]
MRPGPKTKKMISPVQVKLRISKKTRSTMRYDNMALIRKRVKEGSNRYLKELFQSKQRDTSKLWDELGKWHTPETLESFQQNFSTYSWSWTGCRNLLETEDLQSQRLFPSFHTQMSSPPSSAASHSRPLSSACSTDSDPEQVEEVRQVD